LDFTNFALTANMAFYDKPRYFVVPQIQPTGQQLYQQNMFLPIEGTLTHHVMLPSSFPQPLCYIPQTPTPCVRTDNCDFCVCFFLTRDPCNGEFQVMLPVSRSNEIELVQNVCQFRNPTSVMDECMYTYGIDKTIAQYTSKITTMMHKDKSTGLTYKISVVYNPHLSRFKVNNRYQQRNGYSCRIERISLLSSKFNRPNYINDILFAIHNMLASFV